MRYLRMLSNSMAAAALATSYVIALVLHLNPSLPLHPSRLAPLLATVGLYYVFHLTVIAYILLVVRQLLAREVVSPAWLSVDVLTWMSAIAAAAGATLMWRNLIAFSLVLDPNTATALLTSTMVLSATALLCLVAAILRRQVPDARRILGVRQAPLTADQGRAPRQTACIAFDDLAGDRHGVCSNVSVRSLT